MICHLFIFRGFDSAEAYLFSQPCPWFHSQGIGGDMGRAELKKLQQVSFQHAQALARIPVDQICSKGRRSEERRVGKECRDRGELTQRVKKERAPDARRD